MTADTGFMTYISFVNGHKSRIMPSSRYTCFADTSSVETCSNVSSALYIGFISYVTGYARKTFVISPTMSVNNRRLIS